MASSYFDPAAANAILREFYDGQVVENEVYEDQPELAMFPKKTNLAGKYRPVPILYGLGGGRSSSFSTAQGNQSPQAYEEYLVTPVRDYVVATIDQLAMRMASTDRGSFIDAIPALIDAKIRKITLSLGSALARSGSGTIGAIGTITTGVIVLADPNQVVQFEVDDVLQAAATSGGTPRAALGYIVGRDVAQGTITVSATGLRGAAGTPTSWTAADVLLVAGDSNAKISGVTAWLANRGAGLTDTFFGVPRTTDPWRLGGGYYDGSGFSVSEGLTNGINLLSRESNKVPKTTFVSFQSFAALINENQGRVVYARLAGHGDLAEIGFEGIKVSAAGGTTTVFPDRNVPSFEAHVLNLPNWCLDTMGEAPDIFRYEDGNMLLRTPNADAAELRAGYFGNAHCNAPGWSMVMKLSQ